MAPIRLSCALVLLIASSASAVTMDWTPIGNPGNACETQSEGCFGAVGYTYNIGTYEVTNAQYAEFLNAKAAADPLRLYDKGMGFGVGGITRTGSSGSYTYSVIAGRGDMPVNFVSFYDALRFANWLHNGQGGGDTESGAYTLLGGTEIPSNFITVTRNPGASIFVPSEDEWYKAAYHNGIGLAATDYFDYPAGSNTQTNCTFPTAAANSANCDAIGTNPSDPDVDDLTIKGSFTDSASPYGTFDQGGNVSEWNEARIDIDPEDPSRAIRGGSYFNTAAELHPAIRSSGHPASEYFNVGFRVTMLPEPGGDALMLAGIAGLVGLAGWRRARD